GPVTLDAADTFRDVHIVTEVNVVRQQRDASPVERAVVGKARAHRRKHRRAGPDLRMAGHASVGGRQARAWAACDRSVAVAAIDAELARMMTMTERNGLLARVNARAGHPFGSRKSDSEQGAPDSKRNCADEKQAQPRIGGR